MHAKGLNGDARIDLIFQNVIEPGDYKRAQDGLSWALRQFKPLLNDTQQPDDILVECHRVE